MDRLVFAIYWVVSVALGRLSIEDAFRLGWLLGEAAYFVALPYRRLVLDNLRIAFGEEKSPEELRAVARQHFAALGANLFASIKLPRLSREEIQARVHVEGLEEMKARGIIGAGFVVVISHLGSWELFAELSPIIFGSQVGTIFQALGNRQIDAEVRRDRARHGLALFERKEGFSQACAFLRAGGAVGVLADQHAGDAGLWCPFFGRLASTSTLPATLALRTGAWLVPAAVYTDGVARWRCVIGHGEKGESRDAEAVTVRLNEIIEAQIRRQPADWFWVHNRWKTPSPRFLLTGYKRGVALPAGMPAGDLKPFRILIRSGNWLGDAVMSIPAVRAIKRGRIDAHVTVLAPAKLADLWKSVSEVDEIITIAPGEGVRAVAAKIRRHFDVAVLFPNSLRTVLEVWAARIPRRIGYPGHRRRMLLNSVLAPKKKKKETGPPRHQALHYLALAEFLGANITDALESFGRRVPPKTTPPIIGLCPGAEYGPAKRWLPERFAEVMRVVGKETGAEWRIFGVAADRPLAEALVKEAAWPCANLAGRTTLSQLMEELRSCRLLLTNDTGTMHLAAYLGVPTVSIFGSTEPSLTGPLGRGHRVLRHHVACSPCFLRECPLDFRCMKAISAGEAATAVLAALADRTEPDFSMSKPHSIQP